MTNQSQNTSFVYKPKMNISGGSDGQISGDIMPMQKSGRQTTGSSSGSSFGLHLGLQNLMHPMRDNMPAILLIL